MTSTVTINGRTFREVSGDRPKPVAKPKKSKYGNRKTVLDGITFDSAREARRWSELRLLERAGKISGLERQRAFVFAPAVKFDGAARAKPPLRIIVDFYYGENGYRVVEDVKSPASITETFQVKRHLLKSMYGLDIRIVK